MKNHKDRTFSEKVKIRIRSLWVVLILMLVYMIIVGEIGWGDTRFMTSMAETVSTIIFFGGLIYIIVKIIQNKKLLSHRQLLLSQSKKETDERQQFLRDKSGGIVVDILLVCLLFITCTTALLNMPAFYVSFTILSITVILKVISYTVYSRIF